MGIWAAVIGGIAVIIAAILPMIGLSRLVNGWKKLLSYPKKHITAIVYISILAVFALLIGIVQQKTSEKYTNESDTADVELADVITTENNAQENIESDELHRNAGDRFMELNMIEQALPEYEEATNLDPSNALNHDKLAVALAESGRYDEALKENIYAIALEPDVAQYHYNEGVTLFYLKCYDDAKLVFEEAINLQPDNADYHEKLGNTLINLNLYADALPEYLKSVELEPDNATYRNSLGNTLYILGCFEEALQENEKAVELEPNNAVFHNSLGTTLRALKKYDRALLESQTAVDLKTDNALYHWNLGISLFLNNKYSDKLIYSGQSYTDELKKAAELDPDHFTIHSESGRFWNIRTEYSKPVEQDISSTDTDVFTVRFIESGAGLPQDSVTSTGEPKGGGIAVIDAKSASSTTGGDGLSTLAGDS